MELEEQIKVASGAFEIMLEMHFEAWKLSKKENAVARLVLQGYEIFDCADTLELSRSEVLLLQNAALEKIGITSWSRLKSFLTDQLFFGSKRKECSLFIWG